MRLGQELYRFRAIIGHQGPLLASDSDWKQSKYNVQVEWETGEITFEPLSIIAADDPVTCAAYAKENDLLALEGWHRFRRLSKKGEVLARAIKQSMIGQVRRSQTYMFGYLVLRNYMEAMQLDSENKNSKWYDVIKLEMESMLEYKVFKKLDKAILDKHKKVMNLPKGYHRIKVHLVFAVKFDGEAVITTTTMDAILNHCLATARSLTGCLHFVSKTPVDCYTKKQVTVETATYGSEFIAAKTATEQIMDIRQTLRYLGAPIGAKSIFDDNRSVVTSATPPHSTLTKRHNILAFHRVREAIPAKLMACYWIQSAYSLSDILSKQWSHPTVYPMILKLLITRGSITLIPKEATQEKEKENIKLQPEKLKNKEK